MRVDIALIENCYALLDTLCDSWKTANSGETSDDWMPLSASDLQRAGLRWIRYEQQCEFGGEIESIRKKERRHPLVRQLRLFLDNDGLIRCHGRIDDAQVGETTKFPYLLPSKNYVTYLIIQDAHARCLHSGTNNPIAYIQKTFWIPKLRQRVKSILRKCVTCRKVIGKPYGAPETPSLPKDRVRDAEPFSITGVDFTGAITVRNRYNEDTKTYICLFTCATTRAVHLELVCGLGVNSFLQCFRRFVSRRSVPRIMMSDNALTFKAASQEITKLVNSELVKEKIADYGIKWNFIPNRAPWFGGWWERLIGMTKTSLKKVLGCAQVDVDTLRTLLTEIEATLNDRPITYISTDISDPEPLTPSHLIYGRRLSTLPYSQTEGDIPDVIELSLSKLNDQVSRQQKLLQNFFSRWKSEYLTSLREHHYRGGVTTSAIKQGDVVQIHDDSKRVNWRIGIYCAGRYKRQRRTHTCGHGANKFWIDEQTDYQTLPLRSERH